MAYYGGNPSPIKWKDYRDEGAAKDLGKKSFRRLRKVGAFDRESPLRSYNPFLAEGAEKWDADILGRFTGPGRVRMNNRNLLGAIGDIQEGERTASMEAYNRMLAELEAGRGALNAQGDAVTRALNTPAVDAATLASWQAAARERIAREGGQSRAALSARLAGSGQRVDDLNAAYAGQQGDTLFRLGQAEIEQGMQAAGMNRDALIQAISAASGYGENLGQTIDKLLAIEGFRSQLSTDQVNALLALKGLKAAGS